MDFERAALNAFEIVHPNSTLTGCCFHLSSNIWKKVQELGLQGRYNDDEFAMYVRMITTLAFVPLPDLENTFDDLCTDIRNQFNNDMDGLLDYFEDTYVGRIRRNGQRGAPLFSHEMWNMYRRTRDELPQPNYNIEGWHTGIQSNINACHPNFWKFLDVLKGSENMTRISIAQSLGVILNNNQN